MDKSGNAPADDAQYRTVTIRTSDGSTIQGRVHLGGRDRVSDLFTGSQAQFVVLVDVILREGAGKTLILNKDHIVWVEPEED